MSEQAVSNSTNSCGPKVNDRVKLSLTTKGLKLKRNKPLCRNKTSNDFEMTQTKKE